MLKLPRSLLLLLFGRVLQKNFVVKTFNLEKFRFPINFTTWRQEIFLISADNVFKNIENRSEENIYRHRYRLLNTLHSY